MGEALNRKITLARRPDGAPQQTDFRMETEALPGPADGQVLLRTIYLSLDPYMRGRMNDGKSYAEPLEIGETMCGGTVCEIMASKNDKFAIGEIVLAYTGWQEYALSDGSGLRKIDLNLAPISTALGVLGMPGMTAYTGLMEIGKPKKGETVVVAAASGAVGSVVGQVAKIKGCRIVGIAGSQDKCDFVINELGFDDCLNHRDENLYNNLKTACPDGVDIYFENVGGKVLEAVIPRLNFQARIPVCGLISRYNTGSETVSGPDQLSRLMFAALSQRLCIQGFIVTDFQHRAKEFYAEVSRWMSKGKIRYREDVVDGLDNAVEAFQGLLQGKNFGKLLIRVGSDPTNF